MSNRTGACSSARFSSCWPANRFCAWCPAFSSCRAKGRYTLIPVNALKHAHANAAEAGTAWSAGSRRGFSETHRDETANDTQSSGTGVHVNEIVQQRVRIEAAPEPAQSTPRERQRSEIIWR